MVLYSYDPERAKKETPENYYLISKYGLIRYLLTRVMFCSLADGHGWKTQQPNVSAQDILIKQSLFEPQSACALCRGRSLGKCQPAERYMGSIE